MIVFGWLKYIWIKQFSANKIVYEDTYDMIFNKNRNCEK